MGIQTYGPHSYKTYRIDIYTTGKEKLTEQEQIDEQDYISFVMMQHLAIEEILISFGSELKQVLVNFTKW